MHTRILLSLGICLGCWVANAQDGDTLSAPDRPAQVQVGGYVKQMQTLLFFHGAYPNPQQQTLVDTFLQDNLLHQRLNVDWAMGKGFRLHGGLRTRIFYGDLVKAAPDYAALVDNVNNDVLDLSWVFLNRDAWVGHTMLDRLYVEYQTERWEVRLGRQRINWGIHTVWNPNDVFNAFSFTDFDYEERPGSDALRVKYYTGFASSIEVATRLSTTAEGAVAAALWRFNRWGYDFQVLGGYVRRDAVLGAGWAGALGQVGFKGEATYFHPVQEGRRRALAATLGADYSWGGGLYGQVGYLYNSEGGNGSVTELFAFELSARNLYPYRHAVFVQAVYPLTPLLSVGGAVIYSPVSTHALFANPLATFSLRENWDLDFVGQVVCSRPPGGKGYGSPIQAAFLRMKVSF